MIAEKFRDLDDTLRDIEHDAARARAQLAETSPLILRVLDHLARIRGALERADAKADALAPKRSLWSRR